MEAHNGCSRAQRWKKSYIRGKKGIRKKNVSTNKRGVKGGKSYTREEKLL